MTLKDIVEASQDFPDLQKKARTMMKTLEKDPAVKLEVKAMEAFEKTAAWEEKNSEKIEKYTLTRKEALKKYGKIVEQYPDTQAAEKARTQIDALEKGQE